MFKQKLDRVALLAALALILIPVKSIFAEKFPVSEEESRLATKLYKATTQRYTAKALSLLDELSLDFQDSKQHQLYQMEAMYANYNEGEYDKVVALAESFMMSYPYESSNDYVSYMQALALFGAYNSELDNQMQSLLSLGSHDVSGLTQAKSLLDDFLVNYPDSRYYADAVVLHQEIVDVLLHNDLEIARSYRSRKAFFASQDRLVEVLKSAHDKSTALMALRLMEANYRSLRLDSLASIVKAVVLLNR